MKRCPICKKKECKQHLLARFDASGDSGLFGIGLEEGPLCEANEIEEVLRRTRLVWVRSERATGKPKAPEWIIKELDLRAYFDTLGGLGGSDLEKYDRDEDAADDSKWKQRMRFGMRGRSFSGGASRGAAGLATRPKSRSTPFQDSPLRT